jgi:hypothetical protein
LSRRTQLQLPACTMRASLISFFVLFHHISCLFVRVIPRSVASLCNCLRHCVLTFDALWTRCKNFHPLNPGLRDDRDDDHMNSSHLINKPFSLPSQLNQRALSSSKRRPIPSNKDLTVVADTLLSPSSFKPCSSHSVNQTSRPSHSSPLFTHCLEMFFLP